ncbi:unnamed protein product, partial [marine sediment metagenome]
IPAGGDATEDKQDAIQAALGTHDTDIKALLATIAGFLDTEIAAIMADLDNPDQYKADVAALALEATLTAIKGGGWTTETLVALKAAIDAIPAGGDATEDKQDIITTHLTDIKGGGWTTETLVAIKAAIDAIAGVDTYQEQIPASNFSLDAIDNALTADPPDADAENSVVDIDQEAGSTFVLRSLWVNITSFGTAGTKLTFKLWVPLNAVVTMVDSVDVIVTGIQNLMDLFGLPEVQADGIWITVETDSESADAACEGTYKFAKAS